MLEKKVCSDSAVISASDTTSESETASLRLLRRKSATRSRCCVSAMAMTPPSLARRRRPRERTSQSPAGGRTDRLAVRARLFGEHGLDLGLERLRVERLDDVVAHPRLLRRDDVLGLG